MDKSYSSFEEIDDPKLRRTIEGLAKLYHDGDVQAALKEYNNIDVIMGTKFVNKHSDDSMMTNLRFIPNQ